jgi:hypothetical protein
LRYLARPAAHLILCFAPAEAKRIADRLDIHCTPKQGSWLDMAEIELGILGRQCLDCRIAEAEKLRREVAAWTSKRNAKTTRVNWRFTTDDARITLKKLYPSVTYPRQSRGLDILSRSKRPITSCSA